MPGMFPATLGYAVLDDHPVLAGALCDPFLLPLDRRSTGDGAEVALDPGSHVLGIHVARDRDHGVGIPVVGLEPLLNVFEARGREVFHRADGRPGVGVVSRIALLGEQPEDLAVGLVLTLALLVLYDSALLVELLQIDRTEQVAHAVRLHEERHVERVRGDVLEVVGSVAVRRPVHVGGTDTIEGREVIVVVILATVEHQMLE